LTSFSGKMRRPFLVAASLLLTVIAPAAAQVRDLLLRPDGAQPPKPIKRIVRNGPGGSLFAADQEWKLAAQLGDEVEIRGSCSSACTLVVSRIPRERLCFDHNGSLLFHQARNRLSPPGQTPVEWEPDDKATKWMVNSYPDDIRAWIDSKGGIPNLPYEGFWVLSAPDLWKMGYRKCDDSAR
jgi:hypothetical protein